MSRTVTEVDAYDHEPRLPLLRRLAVAAWRRAIAAFGRITRRLSRFFADFGPIVGKELRIAARRKRTYWLRTLYVALLAVTVSKAVLDASAGFQVSPGQSSLLIGLVAPSLVAACGWFQLIAGALIGPVLTSTIIAEERTRRTLRMLMITPLSAWHIVASKLIAPGVQLALLIAASLPALAIVQVYGGVAMGTTLGITALCLANALFAASVGLFVSTCDVKLHFATPLSYLMLLGCYAVGSTLGPLFNPFWAMWIVAVKLLSPAGGGGWTDYVWAVSTALLLLAAFGMTRAAARRLREIGHLGARDRNPAGHASRESRSTLPRVESDRHPQPTFGHRPKTVQLQFDFVPPSPSPRAQRRSRRVGDNPIVWREGNRLEAQVGGAWVRAGVPLFLLLTLLMSLVAREALANPLWHAMVTGTYLTVLLLATALLCAPSITTEKETACWRALLSTPFSGRTILLSKAWAVIQHVYPASLFALGHVVLFTLLWHLRPIVVLHAVLIVVATVPFTLALAMLFSLRVRRTTTAVLSTVLCAAGLWGLVPLAAWLVWGEDAGSAALLINPVYLMGAAAFGATRDLIPRFGDLYPSGELQFTAGVFTVNVVAISTFYLVLAACLFGACLLRFNARENRTS